jgi:hypothetical protein
MNRLLCDAKYYIATAILGYLIGVYTGVLIAS